MNSYQRVYIDETSIDTYLHRPFARAVKSTISGKRYQCVSVVAGQIGDKLIAPMTCKDTMISPFFEAWFERCLLPSLTTKSVIIMDNARFHRMKVLQALASKFGHVILPLSPYSPEL
ncbi:MAG: transposase [Moraxella sp.]|nr:transposase [Moraxella sp.]